MTDIERDRLYEIVFFQYFNNKTEEQLQNPKFWASINAICESYDIDSVQLTKIIRILTNADNAASELETYYLLTKAGLSVRKINRMTGIYWQKQVALNDTLNKSGAPSIKRRITDIIMRNSLKEFVHAMYDIFGVLHEIDVNVFNN